MSGVIDEHGQWEHCNVCGEFVLIQHLLYEPPSARFQYGRDLCAGCAEMPARAQDELAAKASRAGALRAYADYVRDGWDVTLNADNSIRINHIP